VTLRAAFTAHADSFGLDVAFDLDEGTTLGILGPNGSGKSTLLRCIAGLHPLHTGAVVLDGEFLEDAGTGLRVPAEQRPIGMVFQEYLLFPHLSAAGNIAFGLRNTGHDTASAERMARDWLDRVGLVEKADARPDRLSGGEQQRVALARALALEPRLLLLDEPLAAVDAATRPRLRTDLRHRLDGFAGLRLIVTHDPVGAFALADRIIVLEHGRIVQQGTLDEVAARPQSQYVADLVGMNLYRGTARERRLTVAGGGFVTFTQDLAGDVFALVHPRAVSLHLQEPEGSPRNVWHGRAAAIERTADRVRVRVDSVPPVIAEITQAALSELGLVPGTPLWATVKATEVTAYPA
jgi:molybdate transport system ATP-binding protein